MTLKADPGERLLSPPDPSAPARKRGFILLLVVCFLIHASLIALLLHEDQPENGATTQDQEIPVEVVVLPPPEEKPEPQQKNAPPPLDLVTPPVVKAKPPPEKVKLEDVEIAHDAPSAGNAATTAKGTPDAETKAPRTAPPPKLVSPKRAQNQPEQEKAEASAKDAPPNPAAPSAAPKIADDNPDAEPLDKAEPEQPAQPKQTPAQQDTKKPTTQGRKITVAQQLAALSPAPSFSLGSTAKSAPIAGGTERASYESLLFGLIKRQMHYPASLRGRHMAGGGLISLYVDELGNLTHEALYRASGVPDLDAAWFAAVRRAAPFPAPPRGLPHAFTLGYPIEME
ncbi:TonB family protein [Methylocapsa polymorpha]|uniref:TonB family protein n=1 Tax=Methylocapsa polymorpha TaxID=3080828 RepID=A0ABZ0HQV1_9HYPH|nr:TonB family protein [Methylocapsa sp. RX1]